MTPKESIVHMAKITIGKLKYKLNISCIWEQEENFELTVKEDTYSGPPKPSVILDLFKPGFTQEVGFATEEIANDESYNLNRDNIMSRLDKAISRIS